jgi:hypothetical protein
LVAQTWDSSGTEKHPAAVTPETVLGPAETLDLLGEKLMSEFC